MSQMLPYLLHPNKQIREGVARFICLISSSKDNNSQIQKTSILSQEEFYCFVRSELMMFFADKQDIFEVNSPYDIIDRLRPPLTARVMVIFFKKFSDMANHN